MKAYQKLILILIVTVFTISNASAQTISNGITASTNKPVYQPGDKVIISGSIQNIINGNPVTILVRNPIGNVYEVGQVDPLSNQFVHDFVLTDSSRGGLYTVEIKHGNQTGELNFLVNVGNLQLLYVEKICCFKARGNVTINYKDAQVSTSDNSISLDYDASSLSYGTVMQEFQIPKVVVYSPSSLIVQVDGTVIQCSQSNTDEYNILDCPIPTYGKVLKIIGTSVIPEFGSTAMSILTISVIIILTLFTRIKLRKPF